MKYLVLFLLFFSASAVADTINCTAPTSRTDGTPLAFDELSGFSFDLYDTEGVRVTGSGTNPTCSWTFSNPPYGTYIVDAYAHDLYDLVSVAASLEIQIRPKRPSAVSGMIHIPEE